MKNLSQLEEALRNAWARETSSDPENWAAGNPAWGQCIVTSLIVNDYLGGEIVWARATLPDNTEVFHYFNKVDGKIIDLTRVQFPEGANIPEGIPRKGEFSSTREYLFSPATTQEKYKLLKQRVHIFLEG